MDQRSVTAASMEALNNNITISNNNNRERNKRPIRTKRCNRIVHDLMHPSLSSIARTFGEDRRPVKRLFTPEIKRFLKDWLVRRRDNPYPNRDEKKSLSIQTGLTYIQVCNWFANWRRKLKNAGKEPQKKTWGNLIKSYNSQAHGNVEHFSICSDDSIWGEEPGVELIDSADDAKEHAYMSLFKTDPCEAGFYRSENNNLRDEEEEEDDDDDETEQGGQPPECFFVTSTTEMDSVDQLNSLSLSVGNKYKNHIMEKYLRDCQKPLGSERDEEKNSAKPPILSKWLESAAKFKPSQNNYLNWTFGSGGSKADKKMGNGVKTKLSNGSLAARGREELDAAEALTRLANVNGGLKLL